MKDTVFIGLGSNLGDSKEMLSKAIDIIRDEIGELLKCSSYYITEPWGFKSENNFVNAVISITTKMNPEKLLSTMLEIEDRLGRERSKSTEYESRVIDLDILDYKSEIIKTENLKTPHPQLHNRKFVLIPLKEIASEWQHPETSKNVDELIAKLKDSTEVLKMSKGYNR